MISVSSVVTTEEYEEGQDDAGEPQEDGLVASFTEHEDHISLFLSLYVLCKRELTLTPTPMGG